MSVSAIIVTRGDVDLTPVLDSLPDEWERIVWDNGHHGHPHAEVYKNGDDWRPDGVPGVVTDLSVSGRYAAIEHASGELVYVQDDDCVVSDPRQLVSTWIGSASLAGPAPADGSDLSNVDSRDHLVANMPREFRATGFYREHCLVGFGAVFHRDAPREAFRRFFSYPSVVDATALGGQPTVIFTRTCDIVFTALTPRVLVDVPYENLPWASDSNRMWKQPDHRKERGDMLDLVLKVRDG